MEYLGLVLVVVALTGGLVATGIGAGITGGVQSAICSLTGSACPAPGSEVVAGGAGGTDGSGGASGTGGTGARYQEQVSGVRRGKEYGVPLNELEGKPVEFDGWDSAKQNFIETKWGYRGPRFYDEATGKLTALAGNRWAARATRQLDAARGKPLVRHFADPDVARAAQDMFDDRGLDVTVVHTPEVP